MSLLIKRATLGVNKPMRKIRLLPQSIKEKVRAAIRKIVPEITPHIGYYSKDSIFVILKSRIRTQVSYILYGKDFNQVRAVLGGNMNVCVDAWIEHLALRLLGAFA